MTEEEDLGRFSIKTISNVDLRVNQSDPNRIFCSGYRLPETGNTAEVYAIQLLSENHQTFIQTIKDYMLEQCKSAATKRGEPIDGLCVSVVSICLNEQQF